MYEGRETREEMVRKRHPALLHAILLSLIIITPPHLYVYACAFIRAHPPTHPLTGKLFEHKKTPVSGEHFH